MIDRVYKMINDYRYANVDKDKREKQLPKIPVPQKFDLISSNYILQELTSAKNAKVNPSIVSALEIDYANAKFNADDKTKDFMVNIYILNPLAGVAEDDKVLQLQNNGITEKDYIISCNIAGFVKRALKEHDNFPAMQYEEKIKIIEGYADEIIKSNSAKGQIEAAMMNNDPLGGQGAAANDDIVGKLPLALQQIGLAAERADGQGDAVLSGKIRKKMNELVQEIVVE